MLRIVLSILAVIVLLVVGAIFLLPVFLDKEQIVALAADAVREQTGAELKVRGDLDLSVFPTLGISFTRASITMPDKERPDLEVGSASIGVELLPLLTRTVKIDTIAVDGLTARLETAAAQPKTDTSGWSDAELDAWYAEQRRKRQEAGRAAGAQSVLAVPLALDVSRLKVTDARLETRDPATQTTRVVELKSLEARDLNLHGNPIPLAVSLQVPGEQPLNVELEASIAIEKDSDTVRFDGLSATIRGATTEPLSLTGDGVADLVRQTADVEMALEVGATKGQGTVRYAAFESPQIDADLELNQFDPALFALAGPGAAEAAPESPPASGDEPLPLDTIRAIDTRAALDIGQAHFGAHTIDGLSVKLRAVEGVVDLHEASGTLHGGRIDAAATFDGRHNTATLDTRGTVEGLQLASALQAMETAQLLTGSATLNWQLAGRGRTANELVQSLNGPVQLTTQEVVLQGTNVEKLICRAVALTNNERLTATFEPDTRFTALSADVQVTDGRALLQPLRAELARVKLLGEGEFDLLEQDFDATLRARLQPELAELDEACRVSKRLAAIDFPVDCSGNVAGDPGDWCRVDTEKILTDLAVSEGKRRLEKEAGKMFDKLLGGGKKSGEQGADE
ncbi:MAG: AsmA family protein [Halioglobus sp.]|nr:AsmA family protein [Halioglobus sp.]